MLKKRAYNENELKEMRNWFDTLCRGRIELRDEKDDERFNSSLAMYLIIRDIMKDINAVGGIFMSQLEWGSDRRGIPLPVADVMKPLYGKRRVLLTAITPAVLHLTGLQSREHQ